MKNFDLFSTRSEISSGDGVVDSAGRGSTGNADISLLTPGGSPEEKIEQNGLSQKVIFLQEIKEISKKTNQEFLTIQYLTVSPLKVSSPNPTRRMAWLRRREDSPAQVRTPLE